MIHHDVEQGSAEWLQLRLGVPTASQFHRIVTPTGRTSKAAEGYICELVAEGILGRPVSEFDTAWTIRGSELEASACAYYEMQHGMDLQVCGFFMTDDGSLGASPDFLVGDDGLAEIKCPKLAKHVAYLLQFGDVVKDHRIQVQGQMMVTGRKWCDVVSYNDDGLPQAVFRVVRDDEYIEAMSKHLRGFCERLAEFRRKLKDV